MIRVLFQALKHRILFFFSVLGLLDEPVAVPEGCLIVIFNYSGFFHLFLLFPSLSIYRWHSVCLMGHLSCCFTQFTVRGKLMAAGYRWESSCIGDGLGVCLHQANLWCILDLQKLTDWRLAGGEACSKGCFC